jgi:predicted secreted protein
MAGSFGVTFKITISTVLTAVVDVIDITWPKQTAETADKTAHDSAGGYRERIKTGLFNLEPHQITVEWVADETTHAALLTAFNSTDSVNCSIEDATPKETIAYAANIVGLDRVTPLSGVFTAVIDVEPTSQPTIT